MYQDLDFVRSEIVRLMYQDLDFVRSEIVRLESLLSGRQASNYDDFEIKNQIRWFIEDLRDQELVLWKSLRELSSSRS